MGSGWEEEEAGCHGLHLSHEGLEAGAGGPEGLRLGLGAAREAEQHCEQAPFVLQIMAKLLEIKLFFTRNELCASCTAIKTSKVVLTTNVCHKYQLIFIVFSHGHYN